MSIKPLSHPTADTAAHELPVKDRLTGWRLTCAKLVWYLLVASPVIFALVSWPNASFASQDVLRHFSLPIVAVEIAAIVLALAVGFEPARALSSLPWPAKAALLLLVAVAIGTAVIVAFDKQTAILRTATSILHLLFGLSLAFLFSGCWRHLRSVTWQSVLLFCLVFEVILILFVLSLRGSEDYEWMRFKLAVTNVRQLGFYSVVGASAAFGLAFTSSGGRRYWWWVVAAGVLLAISFWSGTRSSLVAFTAAYLISTRIFPHLRKLSAIASLIASMLLGFTLSLIHKVPDPVFGSARLLTSSSSQDPGSGRLQMWLGTMRVYLERPLFGFGESQFINFVPKSEGVFNHPHNSVLQILFQWGLVGALCYFSLALFLWIRLQKYTRKIGSAALPAYLTMVSLLVYSLYEGTLYHPYPIAMLIVAIAWIWASGRDPTSPSAPSTSANGDGSSSHLSRGV